MFILSVTLSIRSTTWAVRALRLIGLLAIILMSSLAWAQGPSNLPANGHIVRPPLSHLYWHFLLFQNHLDLLAAQREQQGKDGSWLRDHFQKKLGFADADYANVRATAQRLEPELKSLDAQAKAIIDAAAATQGLHSGIPQTLPVPPALHALKLQHESMIESEVANLKTALGPQLSAQLDKFLQNRLISSAALQRIPHTQPSTPNVQQNLLQAIQRAREANQ